jgi:hypothetical protein
MGEKQAWPPGLKPLHFFMSVRPEAKASGYLIVPAWGT